MDLLKIKGKSKSNNTGYISNQVELKKAKTSFSYDGKATRISFVSQKSYGNPLYVIKWDQ